MALMTRIEARSSCMRAQLDPIRRLVVLCGNSLVSWANHELHASSLFPKKRSGDFQKQRLISTDRPYLGEVLASLVACRACPGEH